MNNDNMLRRCRPSFLLVSYDEPPNDHKQKLFQNPDPSDNKF